MNYLLKLPHLFRAKDIYFTQKGRLDHFLSAVRRLWYALCMMVLAVMIGTLGYRMIEHTPWFDAYYMSLVTISTVGFGEVIALSHEGRLFTSFLILFNIGFFTYAILITTSIFSDPEIHAFFSDFTMMHRIQKLQQHTIVCGFGRHAGEVCKELAKQKIPFVIIETDAEKIALLSRETDYLFLQGNATTDEVLQEAGIERAKSLVVTLPTDANNVFVVLSARQLNPGLKIISRLNNAYDELKLRRAGANHVVMPEQIGGFYMATLVNKPDLVAFFTLISNMGTNRVIFEEIAVARLKQEFRDLSIAQSGIQTATQVPIMGLRHSDGQYQLNPSPETVLESDMHIVVLGDADQIDRFYSVVLAIENEPNKQTPDALF
jgi:voltage-gated potassium channel